MQGLAGAGEIHITWDTYNYPGIDGILTEGEVVLEQAKVSGYTAFLIQAELDHAEDIMSSLMDTLMNLSAFS